MYKAFKERINNTLERAILLVRNNFVQLAIIGGSFVFLEIIRPLPYVNIIPSYQFLVIGFILFLTGVLFRKIISERLIAATITILFIVGAFLTIFKVYLFINLIGFTVFILLLFLVLRGIALNRTSLKDEIA